MQRHSSVFHDRTFFSPHSHSRTQTLNFWDPSLTMHRDFRAAAKCFLYCLSSGVVGTAHLGVVDKTSFLDWFGWMIKTS